MQAVSFLLVAAYLAVNFWHIVWLAREERDGREAPSWVVIAGRILRYVPPLVGLLYLVTIAGDWPFFLFVVGFFTFAFFLLDRGIGFPSQPPKR